MSTNRRLKIVAGTYNCNQRPSSHVDLNLWFGSDFSHKDVDIYVFCFQELATVDNVSQNPKPIDQTNFGIWKNEVIQFLNKSRDMPVALISESRLGGMLSLSFVGARLKDKITNFKLMTIECSRSKSTIKGAICQRFEIDQFSYAFACVHLTADQETENYQARINDFHKISNSSFNEGFPFPDHDFICWVGDVNFRVNLPRNEIVQLTERKNYDQILEHDQLLIARREGLAFVGYLEGKITFPPSYKYNRGTDTFNLSEPPEKRNPAYPDRIVYKHSDRIKTYLNQYTIGHLKESDHKPIISVFTVSP